MPDSVTVTIRSLIAGYSTAVMLVSGCGQEAPPPQQLQETGQAAHVSAKPPYAVEMLHASGLGAVAIGLSASDPGAVITGIVLLEKAVFSAPENVSYWLDLADAYANSSIAAEYSNAIDIYWMLLTDNPPNQDAILTRLAETYARVGNRTAAHAVGMERLRRATPERADQAALHLVLLALENDSLAEAAAALIVKAKTLNRPAYLLLLASAIEEEAGNPQVAVALIDEAIKKLEGNTPAHTALARARGRISP